MKNKGFTLVELIVSFTLALTISLFLFKIVVSVKDIYTKSDVKTEIINSQSNISKLLNENIKNKKLSTIQKYEDPNKNKDPNKNEDYIEFIYNNGTSDLLNVNYDEKTISFDNYITKLPKESELKKISANVYSSGIIDETGNDSVLIVEIPIYCDMFNNKYMNIKIAYQFNSSVNQNIKSIEF